ncbi:hypothetical protein HanXRQr2_Chr08g0356971 [Helianthus annuus]|uniref:Uncharacterized protein n=1 Tax=Helianthus annuus TaxID=4232 RepID=A0A251SER8_HELAN|nr:hypothetical protein HanXRQr2_Chr08g0356971 [Helianthus annuus]KAJ0540130.1 hypothetical protein HanHA300_Chr08g0294731 [Helianthus annuus]KAJ0554875.1 hypothetical protein HanHA89_Chr08g0313261 [Helianthus annuus]KAJ0720438.1 hypothetical protein HanLR1_Chr08g0293561 [Helianthus annuus]KAJ0903058.1 hypothetical protein HanPSC8_Chr08g0344651 [Helianthus annuus]
MFFATWVRSLNRCPTIIHIHSLPHSLSNHLLPLSKISLIQLVFCRCFSHMLLHFHKPIATICKSSSNYNLHPNFYPEHHQFDYHRLLAV